jgi:plasmid stabilization system protein ParE
MLDDNARQLARQGVAKLERLRQKLLGKLETLLQQAGDGGNRTLLLSGQSLADELAAVEELKQRIDALLEQPAALPPADKAE